MMMLNKRIEALVSEGVGNRLQKGLSVRLVALAAVAGQDIAQISDNLPFSLFSP